MTKLRCPCLNVCIHVKENSQKETEGKTFVSDNYNGTFFSNNLLEVDLGVGGITKEVDPLVESEILEDWDIFTCINCGVKTHALHVVKRYSRVLISKELKDEVLVENETYGVYSLAFRIKVQRESSADNKDNEEELNTGAMLLSQDSVSKSIHNVQEQMKKFLKAEENAMQERIRKFTEQQKKQFAALRTQSYSDKKAICKLIRKMEQSSLTSSLHEAMIDNSERERSPVNNTLLQESDSDNKNSYDSKSPLPVGKPVSQVHITQVAAETSRISEDSRLSNHHHHPHHHRKRGFVRKPTQTGDIDADPMFSLDGFNDDCEPFFESEEDDLSSSDNSFHFEDYSINSQMPLSQTRKTNQMYSASVPIGMPSMNQASRSWDDADDNDDFTLPEPGKIAESMQALAQSIQDSTDMFGELPRPRLNTLPQRRLR